MRAQLRRLTSLVAITAAIVFGLLAAYAYYESTSAQETVVLLYKFTNEAISKCEADRTSNFCDSIEPFRKDLHSSVEFRDKRSEDARIYGALALAVPFLCAFLFIGGSWVMTGSISAKQDQDPKNDVR